MEAGSVRHGILVVLLVAAVAAVVCAGEGGERTAFRCLARVKPRSASEIQASNWSVGAETMDRDCTIYRNWRTYLGTLGFKKARLQVGWAKTEKGKGVYDWAWPDEIICVFPACRKGTNRRPSLFPATVLQSLPISPFSPAASINPCTSICAKAKCTRSPRSQWQRRGTVYEFRRALCYDSPILIADKSLIPLVPVTGN